MILTEGFVQNSLEPEGRMQRDETVFHLHFDVRRYLCVDVWGHALVE